VFEMHGGSLPEMWWVYDENYELVHLDPVSHFKSQQEAIDQATIVLISKVREAERKMKPRKHSCLPSFVKYRISGSDWITKHDPSLIGSNKHGDWYEHPIYGDESPLMLVTKAGVLYRSIWWDYDGEVQDNECC